MPSKEVLTFWLDMGAPISLLSHRIKATVDPKTFACAVKSVHGRLRR